MVEVRRVPIVVTHSAAVGVCPFAQQWATAMKLLWQLCAESVQAEVVVFTAAIASCENDEKLKDALDILPLMWVGVRNEVASNPALIT